ncbi:MAG: hypothetical protein JKY54_17560 [Flavobacteriales bacterium]|nr:hypothetical protein [Flavobacteriales bacterium]
MDKSAKSVFFYGNYVILIGISFLLFPNFTLGILGIEPATEVWIYFFGWFVMWLGIYYVISSLHNVKPFIMATIYGRPTLLAFIGLLVYLKMLDPIFIVFGIGDLLTAIWSYSLILSERKGK